jgi:hypothetical protein
VASLDYSNPSQCEVGALGASTHRRPEGRKFRPAGSGSKHALSPVSPVMQNMWLNIGVMAAVTALA